jgi:hypothetical protein
MSIIQLDPLLATLLVVFVCTWAINKQQKIKLSTEKMIRSRNGVSEMYKAAAGIMLRKALQ